MAPVHCTPADVPDMLAKVARIQLALRAYIARHCPASRLPIELWDIIFDHSLAETPAPSRADAPLNVSQVCRRWRNIAVSNPHLWAGLAITTTRRHTERGPALEALWRLVQLWLRRAAARPLSVSLTHTEALKSTLAAFSPIPLLLTTILAHASHLRTLDLCIPEAFLFPLESPDLYLPVLAHLKIAAPWPCLAAPDTALPIAHAPRLRTLALRDVTFAPIDAHDYTQLTALTLLPAAHAPAAVWSVDDALACLAAAPRLHTLRTCISDTLPRRRTLVHSESLRDLSLEFRDTPTPGAFFSLLYTPRLRGLAVRGGARAGAWPHAQFLAYLGATPALRALHLAHLPLFETQVLECVRRVPALTHLVLEARLQRGVGDTLLSGLTLGGGEACGGGVARAAPGLRSVEFRHCGKRCTEAALMRMVESRRGPLRYLRVHRASAELAARVKGWDVDVVVDVQC
ncbi:hypothetical protein B0H10DRAFT_2211631 [Mycena sp. CBHHK59/15]|nr:hypothetical protein B0H10DRAFT_2211631 [Mycena sp. CBHHK59/15]